MLRSYLIPELKEIKKMTHNTPILSPQHRHQILLCDLRFSLVFLTNSTRKLNKILWIIITRSLRHVDPLRQSDTPVQCLLFPGEAYSIKCLSQILPESHSRSSRREQESSYKYYKAQLYLDTDWRGINESLKRISAASLAVFSGSVQETNYVESY